MATASLLNLHLSVPWKDVRRLVHAHWTWLDWQLVWAAHSRAREAALDGRPGLGEEEEIGV